MWAFCIRLEDVIFVSLPRTVAVEACHILRRVGKMMNESESREIFPHIVFAQWAEEHLGKTIRSDRRCEMLFKKWYDRCKPYLERAVTPAVIGTYRAETYADRKREVISRILRKLPYFEIELSDEEARQFPVQR
jgi:hypothetical protein